MSERPEAQELRIVCSTCGQAWETPHLCTPEVLAVVAERDAAIAERDRLQHELEAWELSDRMRNAPGYSEQVKAFNEVVAEEAAAAPGLRAALAAAMAELELWRDTFAPPGDVLLAERARGDRLEEALAFYAERDTYVLRPTTFAKPDGGDFVMGVSPADEDRGERARRALAPSPEPNPEGRSEAVERILEIAEQDMQYRREVPE